ncbi:LysR family transcriptional regulator [Agarivorans sp. QJM3NY_25]|uniref:LysR family transcriptional regulator n=1 Tax=Agarivorans sp. QJM3NY_25 TaxID=3421430 RepID=UPI003D7E7B4D
MYSGNIDWELYRSFLAVLQQGSLSAAARALNSTQPTIGRHIAALEKALELSLFIRSPDGLLATDAAKALRGQVEVMASTAAAIERVATGQQQELGGVVRITASEVVGVALLPDIITPLQQQYPGLKLELVLSSQAQDLLHREADIAIRMFRPKQTQLVARRVGHSVLALHASPAYLERFGYPESVEALAQHAIIGFDSLSDFIRKLTKSLPPELDRENFAFSCDSDLAQLALIRAGAGIGICQAILAKGDDKLVPVLAEAFQLKMDVWVTMHEDLRNSQPCVRVFEALADGFRTYFQSFD